MRARKITAIDFFDDLSSRHAKRRFFWFFGLATVVFFVAALAFSPFREADGVWGTLATTAYTFSVSITSGSTLILVSYAAYFYFVGPNIAANDVMAVRPEDIGAKIRELPKATTEYYLWGRSASFFRTSTLKSLDEESRRTRTMKNIIALIPDPRSEKLVEAYKKMVIGLDENKIQPLTSGVLATCLSCAHYASNNRFLRIELHLSNYVPAFRIDMSVHGAVLTQDAPQKSALLFRASSEFFEMLKSSIYNEIDVSQEVTWDENDFSGKKPEEIEINRALIEKFGTGFSVEENILQIAKEQFCNPSHRYDK